MSTNIQKMPQNLDAEAQVLSTLLQDKAGAEEIIGAIGDKFTVFDNPVNQAVYRAAYELYKKDTAIDVLTVNSQIVAMGLEKIVTPYELASLIEKVPAVSNIDHHLKLVMDAASDRGLIIAGHDISQMGYARDMPSDEKLAAAEERIFRLRGKDQKDIIEMPDLMHRSIVAIEERYNRGGGILGLDTGFSHLNSILSGFIKKEMYILAAYPSRGKTTWALQAAVNSAKVGNKVAFFSLETHDITIGHRLMAQQAGVNLADMRIGRMNDSEWTKIGHATGEIAELPIYLYDGVDRNIMTIKSRIRLLKMKYDIDQVFIDYVQLMRMPGRWESKAIEMEEISQQLQTLAQEFDICVIPLAQFSRRSMQERREPVMSDLRHSGALEQDAYGIIIIHHPTDIGDNEIIYKGITYTGEVMNDLVKIIVEKNKDGPTGWVLNKYFKAIGRFTENVDGRADDVKSPFVQEEIPLPQEPDRF